jgi:WD40 repeat protein
MASPAAHTVTYTGNRADGNSTNIYGNVYGDVHFPGSDNSDGRSIAHQCLRALRNTDPRDDRARIEQDKDKLRKDCYAWILDDASFQRWRKQSGSRVLWIKGDPGKGKTMLMMGMIAELTPRGGLLSLLTEVAYFFCQSTRPELNNAVSVLRGLIYMLVAQREQLMRHVEKRYEAAGSMLFEGPNAIHALREILSDILNDPSLTMTYLLVDALDECSSGLSSLLGIITDDTLAPRSKVKWLVTSRNVPEIEQYLQPDLAGIKISFEVSANHVSRAVAAFIDFKVQRLATVKKYDARLQAEVQQLLQDKAEGTFLWVSLVCKQLESVPLYRTRLVLQAMPPGLDPLYDRMMAQILAQKDIKTAEYCKRILRSVTVAFRPLHLREVLIVAGLPSDQFHGTQEVADLVSHCGSFLTVRQDTVSFIHLSAKDYFKSDHGRHLFGGTVVEEHGRVTHRLLSAMRSTLRRDMCGLEKPRTQTQRGSDRIKHSILPQVTYACEYWIDHLCDSNLTSSASPDGMLRDQGTVDIFLREKFLYWLEALSLCKSVSKGVASIEKLWLLIQVCSARLPYCDNLETNMTQGREASGFTELVKDAHRFVMYHKGAIENSALQVYVSALLFSPSKSLIRRLFKHEEPKWITIKPAMGDSWSACLQTLEGHSRDAMSVAFSHDSTRVASASWDHTIKIWDVSSGVCLQTLEGHSCGVNSIAFSHDSTRLASASNDKTVKIWNVRSGACLQTLEGHTTRSHERDYSFGSAQTHLKWKKTYLREQAQTRGTRPPKSAASRASVNPIAFLHDSTRLASASDDRTMKIWDMDSGEFLQTFEGYTAPSSKWAYGFDSAQTHFNSKKKDFPEHASIPLFGHPSASVNSVTFSHDSTRLASASDDNTIKIWDVSSGACLKTLEGHSNFVLSVAFSHNSTLLASASNDSTVKIWDAGSGKCLQTLEGNTNWTTSVSFSHDSTWLASVIWERIKIWDTSSGVCLQTLEGHSSWVNSIAFSHNSTRLASASDDRTIKIWDTSSGMCLQNLEGHSGPVTSVAFSHNSTWLASASKDQTVKIWDANSEASLQTIERHSNWVTSVAISHNLTRLASASWDKTVKIWDVSSGAYLKTLEGHSNYVDSVAFSHDSAWIASASADLTAKIWDASSGACLETIKSNHTGFKLSFDPTDTCLLTEYGSIAISAQKESCTVGHTDGQLPQSSCAGVSSDKTWITRNNENVLWLPSEYRAACSTVVGNTIGIGVGSGRVWLCRVDSDS